MNYSVNFTSNSTRIDVESLLNQSKMNVTCNEGGISDKFTFARSIAMLIICIFGFYGNVLSITIFTKPSMKNSINVLLSGLSSIDLFLLVTCVPVFIVPSMLEHFQHRTGYYSSIVVLYLYPLTMSAQTSSVWIFVVISMERYFAVCRPFQAYKIATVNRTRRVVLSVVASAVLYNLIRFWEYRLTVTVDGRWHEPLLRFNPVYLTYYYTVGYLLSHFMFPFLIILILNIHIFKAIKKSLDERARLVASQINQHQTCTMIVVVTCMFALSNSLAFIINIWEASDQQIFSQENPASYVAFILLDVSNICVVINSSSNCIVYLIYCARYRRYFVAINKRLFLRRQSSMAANDPTTETMVTMPAREKISLSKSNILLQAESRL